MAALALSGGGHERRGAMSSWRLARIVGLMALVVWGARAPVGRAAQPSRWTLLARSEVPAFADGRSLVAFELAGHRTELLDAASGRRMVVPTPPGCGVADRTTAGSPTTVPGLAAVSPGTIVWGCAAAVPTVTLYDLRHHSDQSLPLTGLGEASANPVAVGRTWLAMDVGTNGFQGTLYVDRATGKLAGRGPTSTWKWPNLEARPLATSLCKPLRRTINPFDSGGPELDRFLPFAFSTRLGGTVDAKSRVVLQYCGHTNRRVFACPGGCHDLQLSPSLATWSDDADREDHVLSRRTGRLLSITGPRAGQVTQAAHRIYVSRRTGTGWQIESRASP